MLQSFLVSWFCMSRTIFDKFQMKFVHYPRSGKLLSVLAWRVLVLEKEEDVN